MPPRFSYEEKKANHEQVNRIIETQKGKRPNLIELDDFRYQYKGISSISFVI